MIKCHRATLSRPPVTQLSLTFALAHTLADPPTWPLDVRVLYIDAESFLKPLFMSRTEVRAARYERNDTAWLTSSSNLDKRGECDIRAHLSEYEQRSAVLQNVLSIILLKLKQTPPGLNSACHVVIEEASM